MNKKYNRAHLEALIPGTSYLLKMCLASVDKHFLHDHKKCLHFISLKLLFTGLLDGSFHIDYNLPLSFCCSGIGNKRWCRTSENRNGQCPRRLHPGLVRGGSCEPYGEVCWR